MKILILTNSDLGLYKFRKELLRTLVENGNRVFLSLPDGIHVPALKKMGCVFCKTPVDRRGMNPLKDLRLLKKYMYLLKRIKPDVVLTYTIKPNIYGGILCRLCRVKYIGNVTGLGTAIENRGIFSGILLILYKTGLWGASQVFFQNEENRKFFVADRLVKKSRLIPGSGVNLKEHCYEEYPAETGEIRFLFVGRIMKDKGIGELLSCAEHLKGIYPNIGFDLAGDFDEEEYRDRISELEKKGIVRYLEYQEDVHSLMKASHAVIMPSYHEGLSNVLLEAAACGRPVLASKVPGCQETFDEGISGMGFEAKDAESLTETVERFLALPYEEKRKMGVQGRKKMEKEFDRQKVIVAYTQEIEQASRRGKS